jgi:dihydrofolate reductase
MSILTSHLSVSLDGYLAGPDQSLDNPLGEGGERLHEWAFATDSFQRIHNGTGGERNADAEVIDEIDENVGAHIMGRKMFGGDHGPWDESWIGWWGEEPPFHAPVFVLTHHERAPLELQGTTFTFVTDGIESALAQARTAAAGKDVAIAGGATVLQQYLAAGLLDQLYLHIVPVILGGGERLLDNVGDPTLEPVTVVASPTVTHIKYRVVR